MSFFTRFKRPPAPVVDFQDCPLLTAQEFKREADINFLLQRYRNTGMLYTADEMIKARALPHFGDFTGIPDYQSTLDKLNNALEMFSDLPLAVRQRFHDSPVELLAFLQDDANREEAIKLGLVDAPPPVVKDDNSPTDPPLVAKTEAK